MSDNSPSTLNNPLRFSIRHQDYGIGEILDHDNEIDDTQRRVTQIQLRPSEGNVYVYWEVVGDE
jgi:hypothetical protein